MASVKNTTGGARKAPNNPEKGRRTDIRLTPFDKDTTAELVRVAEELSKRVGINPNCVTKKMPSNINADAYERTISDFSKAEQRCAEANNFWLGLEPLSGRDTSSPINLDSIKVDPNVKYIMKEASRIINRVISLPWRKSSKIYFGPGSAQVFTYDRKDGSRASFKTKERLWKLAHADSTGKFTNASKWIVPNRTFQPSAFFDNALSEYISERCDGELEQCDIISCVPKNNEKFRTIGIGSVIGVASQHVIGDYIRTCLQRYGVDLKNLAMRHREFAYLGSVTGRYSTLDFSQASDSISFGLVQLLFNNTKSSDKVRHLYDLMCQCRARYYVVEDSEGHYDLRDKQSYEKFSAMGNCFTFELESLIFMAIGTAIQKRLGFLRFIREYRGRVYFGCQDPTSFGDDLILTIGRLTRYELASIKRWLSYFGLTLNDEKSYCRGEGFRESCGADFRQGAFVRGFYFQQSELNVLDVIRLLNFFHCYHSVSYRKLMAYPILKRVMKRYNLDNYCVGLDKASRLLDAYRIIPNCYLITNEFKSTGKYFAVRDILGKRLVSTSTSPKTGQIQKSYLYTYPRCDESERKGLAYDMDDLLVPFTQGNRYTLDVSSGLGEIFSLGSDLMCTVDYGGGNFVRRLLPPSRRAIWRADLYDRALNQGLLDIREPIVWTAENIRGQSLRSTRFTKNGFDREPRKMLL
jgi:hypothetical protein